jgi:pimeloyl-ACP methyl ester carboxylesterase
MVSLAVDVRGRGRPLVVLPGFGLDQAVMAAAFEPVFAASGVTGWRRLYLDLPGCGKSPVLEPNSDAVLDAVQQTIATLLGSEPFLLAGSSYGGYLAAGLARRLPAQIRGLLLVCSGLKINPVERNLAGVLPSVPEPGWLAGTPQELHQHFGHGIGRQTRSVADRVARAFALISPMDEAYLELLRSTGYQLSDEGSDQTFDGDVAILVGRRDRIAGYVDQFEALARYPRGSYTAFPDAGHHLPFERPELFAALTLEWLARFQPVHLDDPVLRLPE